MNIASLEKALRGENDTEIDNILNVFAEIKLNPIKPALLTSTHLEPLMKRVKYDARC